MKPTEITVRYEHKHLELFNTHHFYILVDAKFPGHFFKLKLRELVYLNKEQTEFENFLDRCIWFVKDEKRVKAYAVSMIEEELAKMKKNGEDQNKVKQLRKLMSTNKIKFTHKIKGVE